MGKNTLYILAALFIIVQIFVWTTIKKVKAGDPIYSEKTVFDKPIMSKMGKYTFFLRPNGTIAQEYHMVDMIPFYSERKVIGKFYQFKTILLTKDAAEIELRYNIHIEYFNTKCIDKYNEDYIKYYTDTELLKLVHNLYLNDIYRNEVSISNELNKILEKNELGLVCGITFADIPMKYINIIKNIKAEELREEKIINQAKLEAIKLKSKSLSNEELLLLIQ